MSILSGFFKTKKYRKTPNGYKLQSEWASSETIEMGDGNTLEKNLGAIKGITDSSDVKEKGYALDATVMNQLGCLSMPVSGKKLIPSSEVIDPLAVSQVCSIFVNAGTYFVSTLIKFGLPCQTQIETHIYNVTDKEYIFDSVLQTLPTGLQHLNNSGFFVASEDNTQLVLCARQNSGQALECNGVIRVTKIK